MIYLDPDIYVYDRFSEIENALNEGYDFVVTPHMEDYYEEDKFKPDEHMLLITSLKRQTGE